jgi:hypothetical protein
MSENSMYQEIRSHLAYLRLGAAAEALPSELEHARAENLGHSEFLHRLLGVVGGPAGALRLSAVPVDVRRLRLHHPALG